jgi:translation elongation factor EF-1beta
MSIERKPCCEDISKTKKAEIAFGLKGEDLYKMVSPDKRHSNGARIAAMQERAYNGGASVAGRD